MKICGTLVHPRFAKKFELACKKDNSTTVCRVVGGVRSYSPEGRRLSRVHWPVLFGSRLGAVFRAGYSRNKHVGGSAQQKVIALGVPEQEERPKLKSHRHRSYDINLRYDSFSTPILLQDVPYTLYGGSAQTSSVVLTCRGVLYRASQKTYLRTSMTAGL